MVFQGQIQVRSSLEVALHFNETEPAAVMSPGVGGVDCKTKPEVIEGCGIFSLEAEAFGADKVG